MESRTAHITKPVKVAVMGCVVNGPGEAKEADIAYCGGKDSGALYIRGKFVKKILEKPADALIEALGAFLQQQTETGA